MLGHRGPGPGRRADRQSDRACAPTRRPRPTRRRSPPCARCRDQLAEQVAATGTSSFELIDDVARATRGGRLRRQERRPADAPGRARTAPTSACGSTTNTSSAPGAGKASEDEDGEARARARLDLVPVFSYGGGGVRAAAARRLAPCPRSPTRSGTSVKDEIAPPAAVRTRRSEDERPLPLGAPVAEARRADAREPHARRRAGDRRRHNPQGWHFQCDDSGAIDLTFPGAPGGMAGSSTRSGRARGARLPRALARSGHARRQRTHAHRHRSGRRPERPGGVSATGPLQDSWLQIRLIDWNAPDITGYAGNFARRQRRHPRSGPPGSARSRQLTCRRPGTSTMCTARPGSRYGRR
jgi:hypothetical protein